MTWAGLAVAWEASWAIAEQAGQHRCGGRLGSKSGNGHAASTRSTNYCHPAPLPGAPTLIGCATFRVAVVRVRLNASVKRPRPWPRSLTGTVAVIGPTRRSQFPRRSCVAPPPVCRSIFPGICEMSKRWPLNLSPPNRFPGEPAQSAELAVATSPVLGGSGKHPLV